MSAELDYLDHLTHESARFERVLGLARPTARVPSCPDWDADDLLWHLASVQWFWGSIVREGLTQGAQIEGLAEPGRPAQRAALGSFFGQASADLAEILATTAPDTQAWTWSREQTVGFIRRRQAHEALIHRVDAELTAGSRTPMDARLSADGVDEVLRIMYGGVPGWGRFTADPGQTLRIEATDTGDSWYVTLGRFTGTDPADGASHDEPDIGIADSDMTQAQGDDRLVAAATVRGTAADLDCWLWHRPSLVPLERLGADSVLGRFEATIARGIN